MAQEGTYGIITAIRWTQEETYGIIRSIRWTKEETYILYINVSRGKQKYKYSIRTSLSGRQKGHMVLNVNKNATGSMHTRRHKTRHTDTISSVRGTQEETYGTVSQQLIGGHSTRHPVS